MSKFRKRPVVIDATEWFKNGDHPQDLSVPLLASDGKPFLDSDGTPFLSEGKVVRYFRNPDLPDSNFCNHCQKTMHHHGWIDTLEGGHIVCPGDWVITGVKNEMYPCKPEIFLLTYEPVDAAAERDYVAPAEALFAFAGWLTSREGVSGPFSECHDAADAAKLVGRFNEAQGWEMDDTHYSDVIKKLKANYPD